MIKSLSHNGEKTVGESIRDLRNAKGLSVTELADLSGIHRSMISRWERGERVPSVENYNKVMTALGAELTVVEK